MSPQYYFAYYRGEKNPVIFAIDHPAGLEVDREALTIALMYGQSENRKPLVRLTKVLAMEDIELL